LSEFVDMEGLVFFSQYLNSEVNKRLTPSSTPVYGSRLGIRLSPKLADSTQLVIKLKFKDLKKDFLDILFFHGAHLLKEIMNINQYYFCLTLHMTYILSSKKTGMNEVIRGTCGRK